MWGNGELMSIYTGQVHFQKNKSLLKERPISNFNE
jgi:hypothetical protein